MTTTDTAFRQMWDRAIGVYGRRGAADFNADELSRETGTLHYARAFIEEWRGEVFTHYGVFADMDQTTPAKDRYLFRNRHGKTKSMTGIGIRYEMQRHGFRFSELHAHMDDLDAGHTLVADDGSEFAKVDPR